MSRPCGLPSRLPNTPVERVQRPRLPAGDTRRRSAGPVPTRPRLRTPRRGIRRPAAPRSRACRPGARAPAAVSAARGRPRARGCAEVRRNRRRSARCRHPPPTPRRARSYPSGPNLGSSTTDTAFRDVMSLATPIAIWLRFSSICTPANMVWMCASRPDMRVTATPDGWRGLGFIRADGARSLPALCPHRPAGPRSRPRSARDARRVRGRRAPAARTATRSSDRTRCPTASHIRLTWRLRPSWIVSSSVSAVTRRRTRAGARRPVVQLTTPRRSARSAASDTGGVGDDRPVGLVDLKARVGEPVGELAVVGEQDQPGGVDVEPPHRIQPQIASGRATRPWGGPAGRGPSRRRRPAC